MVSSHDLLISFEHDKPRPDQRFHALICRFTESQIFNGMIMFVILVNSVMIAIETDPVLVEKLGVTFDILDYTFLAIYTVEFVLKIYAEPLGYWQSYYNIFDFIVLAISWVQTGIELSQAEQANQQNLKGLQVLRALRALRALRTVSFIRGLQVLVTALIDTIHRWVINIMVLLLLFMYLFAIMGYYFWGSKGENADKENWGNLGSAMLSLVNFVTVDGWTELQNELDKMTLASRMYTITFIFLGNFILTNIFVGVIIINISEATERFEKERIEAKEAVVKLKKEFMMRRQHEGVQQMLERQKRGSFSNFAEMVLDFEKCLHHDDCELTSDLCTNLLWLETFTKTLDHMDHVLLRTQHLHFEMANLLVRVEESKLEKKFRMQ